MTQSRQDLQEELDLVSAAIKARMQGVGHMQSVGTGSKSFTYTPLKELREHAAYLRGELRRLNGPVTLRPNLTRRRGR
ncbi:MAG: hypothetical protein AAF196_09020 [Planctomycetota bacterium]